MRNRLIGSTLAVVALLVFAFFMFAQTSEQPGVAKAHVPPDLAGVWRRSRRPPDNARRYTIFELAMSITSGEPPMTPWAEAKFKANKPNIGPNAVPLAETNDPVSSCSPP